MDLIPPTPITREMDRLNGRIFLLTTLLIYLAAPVTYIGVIQAALCERLGADAALANLPAAAFLLGQFAPFIFSWLVPHRLERATVVWSTWLWAALIALVLLTLATPQPAWVRVTAVSAQGLLQGALSAVAGVFSWQCLNRGTTLVGRVQALKWTFSLGPLAAVAGSLAAQYLLNHHIFEVRFPLDFALIYLLGAPCIAVCALLNRHWRLPVLADEPRVPFLRFTAETVSGFVRCRPLLLLFLALLLINCAMAAMADLSLHTRQVVGREPGELAGLVLLLRFACKVPAGYLLGALTIRFGFRTSVIVCAAFNIAGIAWAGLATGYPYLLAFGFLGMGELAGVYFPGYALTLAPPELGPRNISFLTLTWPAASFAPLLFGVLTDRFGFSLSLLVALVASLAALLLLRAIKT